MEFGASLALSKPCTQEKFLVAVRELFLASCSVDDGRIGRVGDV